MRRVVRGLGIMVILGLMIAVGGYIYVKNELKPVSSSGQEVIITLKPGMGSSAIADELEQSGLIRNATLVKVYLKLKDEGSRFQAGTYAMKPSMELNDIIAQLNQGNTVKAEVIRFTIPEGYTLVQIADKLASEKLIDKKVFLQLAAAPKELDTAVKAYISQDAAVKHPIEGYLFPETYELAKDSTEQDILLRMMDELGNKLSSLPADWETKMKAQGLTFHQMLTIASLVEREVIVDGERTLVAGIIYNRIKKKMPLQIDATVQYLFDKQKSRLYEKDLRVESAYNTYLHTGLPPGPIASPSIASIKSTLYPKSSKYLFYVTKKDGTQTHLFAETYTQHKKNIKLSNQLAKS